MINTIVGLFSFLIFCNISYAQSLQIQANFGYSNHTTNNDNENIEPIVPSIGVFFDDSFNIGAAIYFNFFNISRKNSSPFISCSYEYSSLNSIVSVDNVLGEVLNINSLGVSVGYKFALDFVQDNFFIFLNAKYLKKFYEGISDLNNDITAISKYINGNAVEISTGFEFINLGNYPLGFGVYISYEFGTVKRDNIEFYENDLLRARLIPAGDLVLPDDTFSIRFTINYFIGF